MRYRWPPSLRPETGTRIRLEDEAGQDRIGTTDHAADLVRTPDGPLPWASVVSWELADSTGHRPYWQRAAEPSEPPPGGPLWPSGVREGPWGSEE